MFVGLALIAATLNCVWIIMHFWENNQIDASKLNSCIYQPLHKATVVQMSCFILSIEKICIPHISRCYKSSVCFSSRLPSASSSDCFTLKLVTYSKWISYLKILVNYSLLWSITLGKRNFEKRTNLDFFVLTPQAKITDVKNNFDICSKLAEDCVVIIDSWNLI